MTLLYKKRFASINEFECFRTSVTSNWRPSTPDGLMAPVQRILYKQTATL